MSMRDDDKSSNGTLVDPSHDRLPHVKVDAGLRGFNHYRQKLPSWRYIPRQTLLPVVRWETPYLFALQARVRCTALDTYFSTTACLGTHTFFMIFLPILFWCGYTEYGRGLVHILASGVIFSGYIKDLLCVPRPLSPPLTRISLSTSASLEYGFPSTHSTNAVSVAVYALFMLHRSESAIQSEVRLALQIFCCAYAISIVSGRLYCGMHGFLDVAVGSFLGAALALAKGVYGPIFDEFIFQESLKPLALYILILLVLVRLHPEPADNCPCFDDSVAFAGVLIGVEAGNWHFARTGLAWNEPFYATVPFQLDAIGIATSIMRILTGVLVVFAWRELMKPALLRSLPPLFRIIEKLGLSLPRRFFIQASEYRGAPDPVEDDNVIPSVSGVQSILTSLRHPRKNRSISMGPQSEADAYEILAFRDWRRRESTSSASERPETNPAVGENSTETYLPTPPSSSVGLSKQVASDRTAGNDNKQSAGVFSIRQIGSRSASQDRREYEKDEREVFSKLEKPRVRYDVEVITKLIVYTGIAWLAVEGNPIIFQVLGLGMPEEWH